MTSDANTSTFLAERDFGLEYELSFDESGRVTFVPGDAPISGAIFLASAAVYDSVPLVSAASAKAARSSVPSDFKLTIWEIDSSRDYVANHFGILMETNVPLSPNGLQVGVTPFVRNSDGKWVAQPSLADGEGLFEVKGLTATSSRFQVTSMGWRSYRCGKDAALFKITLTARDRILASSPFLALPNYKLEAAVNHGLSGQAGKVHQVHRSSHGLAYVPSVRPALFGTSGVRGKLGYEIGEDTILVTSQALVNHIRNEGITGPIVVGGDTRFSSEDFCRTAAEVFAAHRQVLSPRGEYPAVLFMEVPHREAIPERGEHAYRLGPDGSPITTLKPYVPTPLMTVMIRLTTAERPRAAAGVAMTASHNYATDNGYKSLRGLQGGVAQQWVTDQLQLDANAMLTRGDLVERVDFASALNMPIGTKRAGETEAETVYAIKKVDPRDIYFREHLMKLVDFDVIRQCKPRVAADFLYGTGIGFLDVVLEEAIAKGEWPIIDRRFHYWRDPSFGGGRPDCEDPENIRDMIDYCAENRERVDVGLAVDSDSDRFGIVDPELGLINANHILAALFRYRHENPLKRPEDIMGSLLPACRTIVTSHILDAMAARFGSKLLALPRIGFKWIGDRMNDQGLSFVIAGEESSGLSVLNFPEKDGILADLLVLEMMGAYGLVEQREGKRNRPVKPLREILQEIWQEYGPWYFRRVDLYGIKRKQKVMDFFRKAYRPPEIAGRPMEEHDKIKAMFTFYDQHKLEDCATEENRISGSNPLVGDGVKYYLKLTNEDMSGFENAPWRGDGIVSASVHVRESGNEPVIRVYTQHRTSQAALDAIERVVVKIIREVDG